MSHDDRVEDQGAETEFEKDHTAEDPRHFADGRMPSSAMRSYALLTPEIKQAYMKFYKTTYANGCLDLKTKELVAIGAALAMGCKGCLEGHMKKAKKLGVTAAEMAEVVGVTLGVAGATIVDRSDIANFNLGDLFEMPE
ncbi:MAG: carboxymuconolactone decarboxylase family protein [Planctomycetota bacterium]|jgi:AhpD family alkylhydroperoxidase